MAEWFSIEVLNGPFPARTWFDAYADMMVEAGIRAGASNWQWHHHRWGVLLEIELPSDLAWEAFREVAAVKAALDAVPDPVNGLLVHRGRGGSAGSRLPRHPHPRAGSGAVVLPLPDEESALWDVLADPPSRLTGAGRVGLVLDCLA